MAVISDTHLPRGGRALPAACRERLAAADLILHAGDFVSASVLDELAQLAPVEAVYGNMDESALREQLPYDRIVEAGGARIGMVHIPGPRAGRHARLVERFPRCHAVVYGHTHEPEASRFGETLILNPGSPTERRRAPSRSMAVVTVEEGALSARLISLP